MQSILRTLMNMRNVSGQVKSVRIFLGRIRAPSRSLLCIVFVGRGDPSWAYGGCCRKDRWKAGEVRDCWIRNGCSMYLVVTLLVRVEDDPRSTGDPPDLPDRPDQRSSDPDPFTFMRTSYRGGYTTRLLCVQNPMPHSTTVPRSCAFSTRLSDH